MKVIILKIILSIGVGLLLGQSTLFAQQNQMHYFSFRMGSATQLDSLSRIISIDKVTDSLVEAFANNQEFDRFLAYHIGYKDIESKIGSKTITMATTVDEMANWNRYPTYTVYETMMEAFALNYPDICKLEEIGTLSSGRKLLAVKISDNVNSDHESEPELLYSSSMHGDEITGYVLMLRLIDYLLTHYGDTAYAEVNQLINNTEIWINPLANPDGTYISGNSDISGAIRYNGNYIDLNRNFPNMVAGEHPDEASWQEETLFMMDFADAHHFALAANFHGGSEVVNYPWDTWSRLAADDSWWQYVSLEYATYAQENGPSGYFTDINNNGIINGYAWYSVYGGRQDYMNFYRQCREVTIEISTTKKLSSSSLPNYWDYNRDALIHYLLQGLNGVQGVVTNTSMEPLHARVTISGHDQDSSWFETDNRAGDYARFLKAGTYDLTFTLESGQDSVITGVVVADDTQTRLNVVFEIAPEIGLSSDSIYRKVFAGASETDTLTITNSAWDTLDFDVSIYNEADYSWISLINNTGSLVHNKHKNILIQIDTEGVDTGLYCCQLLISGDTSLSIPLTIKIVNKPLLQLNKDSFTDTLLIVDQKTDTLILLNVGAGNLDFSIAIQDETGHPWLAVSSTVTVLEPGEQTQIPVQYFPSLAGVGNHVANIIISGDISDTIPVSLHVDTVPFFKVSADTIELWQLLNSAGSQVFDIKNAGGGWLCFNLFADASWLRVSTDTGTISGGAIQCITLSFTTYGLPAGQYSTNLLLTSTYDTLTVPVILIIDEEPPLVILSNNVIRSLYLGRGSTDSIRVTNQSSRSHQLNPVISYYSGSGWLAIADSGSSIPSGDTIGLKVSLLTDSLAQGTYTALISLGDKADKDIFVQVTIRDYPVLVCNTQSINIYLVENTTYQESLQLENTGSGVLDYNLQVGFADESKAWMWVVNPAGSIEAEDSHYHTIYFSADSVAVGEYSGSILYLMILVLL